MIIERDVGSITQLVLKTASLVDTSHTVEFPLTKSIDVGYVIKIEPVVGIEFTGVKFSLYLVGSLCFKEACPSVNAVILAGKRLVIIVGVLEIELTMKPSLSTTFTTEKSELGFVDPEFLRPETDQVNTSLLLSNSFRTAVKV